MSSLRERLARLAPPLPRPSAGSPAPPPPAPPRASGAPPTLDELRDRIARIVARTSTCSPRADPSQGELPFLVEPLDSGPLYARRVRSAAAARVGRVPLWPARLADRSMLARLALDERIEACDPARALYLDTETTGLAGGTGTVAFLIGLAWFEPDGSVTVEQLLLRRLGEEAPMLETLARRLEGASMIVTFNGKSFDVPLLRTRYVMNRLEPPMIPAHLDLVHVARRVHKETVALKSLASLESAVLGHGRVDDVSGSDVVAAYAHFLRTGDEAALLGVVAHNAQDVLSMVALVGMYGDPGADLAGADLAGVARTLHRAGALDAAAEIADLAVARGGGAAARRARADVCRARGDKDRAIADYEAALDEVEDVRVRLALAKLYEHHVRAPKRALEHAERGTGESEAEREKRIARLRRKLNAGPTSAAEPTSPARAQDADPIGEGGQR